MDKKSSLEVITDVYFSGMSEKVVSVVYLLNGSKKKEPLSASDIVLRILAAYKAYLKDNDIHEEIPFSSIQDVHNFSLSINEKHKITIKTNNEKNAEAEDVWEVNISGGFFSVEHFRECILVQLRTTNYSCYCLKDQVSAEIGRRAYPLINELENLVREYLLRFFVKKVGSNWWTYNSTDALRKKTEKVGTNRSMTGLLEMEIYNIDFVDLQELITGCFPRLSPSDIVQSLDSINDVKDNPEKIQEKIDRLKQNFLGNWEKFFQEHIQIENFKLLWGRLYDIRCMVCHNSLITLKCFLDLVNFFDDIKPKFTGLIANTETISLSAVEKEAIVKNEQAAEITLALEALPIKFIDNDIRDLIKSGTLNLTTDNLSLSNECSMEEFKTVIEDNVVPSLSPIGEIETFVIQGEEIGIPSCWIKFKSLRNDVLAILKKMQ